MRLVPQSKRLVRVEESRFTCIANDQVEVVDPWGVPREMAAHGEGQRLIRVSVAGICA